MNLNVVHALLPPSTVVSVRNRLQDAPWADGRSTAGAEAARIKHNLQLELGSATHRELSEVVKEAATASDAFKQLTLPRRMSMPLFSRYEAGMEYGPHTDDAYRAHETLRTDLAVTLFLSAPDDYDGGALMVGDTAVKPAAGDAVVYPATTIHRVSKVTRGERASASLRLTTCAG